MEAYWRTRVAALPLAVMLVGAFLTITAPAVAATLEVQGGNLHFQAAAGEINVGSHAHYDLTANAWTHIGVHNVALGAGCELEERVTGNARCVGNEGGPLTATFELGDGDDAYTQFRGAHPNSAGEVILDPPLDDPFTLRVDGGSGNDQFNTDVDGAPMYLNGEEGDDLFWFHVQETPGTFGLPADYHLSGGEGNDVLEPWAPPRMPPPGTHVTSDWGPGNDQVWATTADDTVEGGPGEDRILDPAGNNVLNGGDGNDRVEGGAGEGVEIGGPGNDWIQSSAPGAFGINAPAGSYRIEGGPGDDHILSRNAGIVDEVSCGPGDDLVEAETTDVIGIDCEQLVTYENCGSEIFLCAVTVTLVVAPSREAGASSSTTRPILGETHFKLRGNSTKGKLPLSRWGRAYVKRRGTVRVLRIAKVAARPGHHSKPLVKRTIMTLKAF